MAKKKTTRTTTTTTTTTSNYHIVKLTAFWGIIIAGIVSLVTLVIKLLIVTKIITGAGSTVNTIVNVFKLISDLALFVSVFLAGLAHSRSQTKTWRTLFIVFAVLAFLGILGLNIMSMF